MVFFPDHAILPSVRAQATEANVQETVEAPPFTPLQARIHEVDLPTFDFLVSLGVFSARELRGDSSLDRGHLEDCLSVGRTMAAQNLTRREEFDQLLAASYVDFHPSYVYLSRGFDLPNLPFAAVGQLGLTITFESEPCSLDPGDFESFRPCRPSADAEPSTFDSFCSFWSAMAAWFTG